jgi:methionine-rich copper-binding protein CopC
MHGGPLLLRPAVTKAACFALLICCSRGSNWHNFSPPTNKRKDSSMARSIWSLTAAALAACAIATAADASPRLVGATPTPGSVVKSGPTSIRINFSEPIDAAQSGVAIANDSGQPLTTGKAGTNGNNIRQMVVPITGKIEPGMYTVVWHAVGRDAKRVNGTFFFELKP